MQDTSAACNAYGLAVQKLQASIQFARGDVAPYNALGDAFVGWAERLPDHEAMQQLQLAVDQGYQQALHVNASSSEAMVGLAEAKGKMGKLCQAGFGPSQQNIMNAADQHFQEGAQAYQRALQTPCNLGSLQQREEIRYNYACLLCLCGQHEAAMQLLAQLLKNGNAAVGLQDLITDDDLTGMRDLPAFQHLSQQANTGDKAR